MYWPKLTHEEVNQRVNKALSRNIGFESNHVFGLPGSWLNRKVFPPIEFLKDAPYMRALAENPNHIGCHTTGTSEKFFEGTHSVEREVIRICASEILSAEKDTYDGYIPSGGTEGNIQAVWIYRNYFNKELNLGNKNIAVVCGKDTHYSIHKACNLLDLENIVLDVREKSRQIDPSLLEEKLVEAQARGVSGFVFVLSMGTTMFGSVDKIKPFLNVSEKLGIKPFIHIDAAFGGFIYPFSGINELNFRIPEISSFSLDGHKMLQSPYGTGLFLIRKGLINYVSNEKASYVKGHDQTLCGSRSGASAIAMWMILSTYGSEGWKEFIVELIKKTKMLTQGFKEKGIEFFCEDGMNLVTIPTGQIKQEVLDKYHWVSDNAEAPKYYKAVIMDHVQPEQIKEFLRAI